MKTNIHSLATLGCLCLVAASTFAENLLFVGTYTRPGKSKGIYAYRLAENGALTPLGLMAEASNPSFLALHPTQKYLYAANELAGAGGSRSGGVSAYAIDSKTSRLTLLNQQPSGGNGPCHVSVDGTGKTVLVANYGSGSISALPIREDGSLGSATAFVQHQGASADRQRQAGPHAHFIIPDPSNRFVLACDLGLDKVLVYRFDAGQGTLTANEPPWAMVKPGSGARHLAFHPNHHFVYVLNEIASTLTVFGWDGQRGLLSEVQTLSTLPADFKANNTTAEVEVHPSGRFLYASNRGHDSIAVFTVNPETGRLSFLEHTPTQGNTPRHFAIDPAGRFLLAENQGSDNIVVFQIDAASGRLKPTGQTAAVGSPVCIRFLTDRP